MRSLLFCLAITVALIGCSRSSYNPTTWFQEDAPNTLEPEDGYTPAIIDNRPLVDQVVSLRIEQTPGGAIVHAVGLPPRQEFWDADLIRVRNESVPARTAVFEFRLRPPLDQVLVGDQDSREIQTAAFLSSIELRDVSRVTVVGQQNSRSTSR